MERKELTVRPVDNVFISPAANLAAGCHSKLAAAGLKRFCLGVLTGIILFFLPTNGHAANWYVRPSSTGSNNGSDWNNAWSISSLNSSWSSISAGDTIWLAGGSYTTAIVPNKSGSSGSLIYVKRVLSSDPAPTAAAGWSSSFDSLVTIHPSNIPPIDFTQHSAGSYMYFDGRTNYGIKLIFDDFGFETGGAVSFDGAGPGNITFDHIDMQGPGGRSHTYANNPAVVNITWGGANNISVLNCKAHGAPNILRVRDASNVLFDHCIFYDNNSANTAAIHPNFADVADSSNLTLRYCDISDWPVEGLMLWGNVGAVYVYGCVWHDPASGPATVVWPAGTGNSGGQGPVYFYNNTFVGVEVTSGQGNAVAFKAGSQVRNNVYWNAGWYSGSKPSDIDYDFSDATVDGAHSISGGSNPFVNYNGKDYGIVSTIGSKYPKDKGVALSTAYKIDMAGKTRGADGAWDIGAYEFGSSGPATNPVIAVSPGSLDFGSIAVGTTKNLTLAVQNAGAGTLSGTASVSAPFSIVSGGTYSLGSNQSQVVTVRYSPTSASSQNQAVTFTGGGGSSATVSGSAWTILPGLSFDSFAGTITAPFVANGSYVTQPNETGVADGGRAVYGFTITTAGSYNVSANVNAPNAGSDSLFANIDAEPTDPDMIWDIAPFTTGFESRTVSWRGNGTFDSPQFPNKVFNLSAGTHQLIIRGREPNVQLGKITIAPSGSATNLPPVPPLNLRIAAVP